MCEPAASQSACEFVTMLDECRFECFYSDFSDHLVVVECFRGFGIFRVAN